MGAFGNTFGDRRGEIFSVMPFASDLSLLYYTYSNGYIREQSGLDAQIIGYPELNFISSSLCYADNGALDIITTGEISISMWVNPGADITTIKYVMGKTVSGAMVGRYGIYISASQIRAVAQDSTSLKTISSTSNIVANTWYHVVLTVKNNNTMHLYINKVEQGTGLSVGSFSSLGNQFEFYVGGSNAVTGDGTNTPFTGKLRDCRVFSRIINSGDIENCFNEVSIGNEVAYWPLHEYGNDTLNQKFFDITSNTRHLSIASDRLLEVYKPFWSMGVNNSNKAFLYGYDIYGQLNGSKFLYVPHKTNGSSISVSIGTDVPSTYKLFKNVSGSSNGFYNMAPCLIDFNPTSSSDGRLSIFDRSNTTIHTSSSRSSADYDASHPFRFSSLELNINTLKGYLGTDYKWKVFPYIGDNSVYNDERHIFKKLLVYQTNKTASQKIRVLRYTGDINKFYTLDYYFEDRHISAQRDNKVLFCDDAGGLSLSLDGGDTITRTLNVSAVLSIVTFAHFFSNGNILFCGQRKAYISTDGLTTYSEINVKDHNGDNFTASGDGVFRSIGYDFIDYEGQEFLLFGCYAIESGTVTDNMNIWFSRDNGLTLRSIYKFGVSSPLTTCRHIHGVHFNPEDKTFWIQTGDGSGVLEEVSWIRGVYNGGNSFTWTILATDNGAQTGTYLKAVGFIFHNNYLYWGTDATGSTTIGIWRTPYSNLLTVGSYEKLVGGIQSIGFIGNGNEMILVNGSVTKRIAVSCDGKHFYVHTCTGGVSLDGDYQYLINLRQKNSDGYYVVDQTEAGDVYPNFTQGQSLMIKIDKNN
ncbi:MAG TPA: LamG domain-containing protein [Candidatus Paceibacterota bacterium]|nr:LamG domain-containing protein [Candidatus Paceibacterota bacterium]